MTDINEVSRSSSKRREFVWSGACTREHLRGLGALGLRALQRGGASGRPLGRVAHRRVVALDARVELQALHATHDTYSLSGLLIPAPKN